MLSLVLFVTDLSKARLGVFGGSGLYSIEDLSDIREIDIKQGYLKTKLFSDTDISNFTKIILKN